MHVTRPWMQAMAKKPAPRKKKDTGRCDRKLLERWLYGQVTETEQVDGEQPLSFPNNHYCLDLDYQ